MPEQLIRGLLQRSSCDGVAGSRKVTEDGQSAAAAAPELNEELEGLLGDMQALAATFDSLTRPGCLPPPGHALSPLQVPTQPLMMGTTCVLPTLTEPPAPTQAISHGYET